MLDVWKEQAPFQRQATKVRKLKKKVKIEVRGILFVCLFVYLVGWLYSLSKVFFWGGGVARETIYVQKIVMALQPGLPDLGLSDAVGRFPLLVFLP